MTCFGEAEAQMTPLEPVLLLKGRLENAYIES